MRASTNRRFVITELGLAAVSGLLALVVAVVALRVGIADLGVRWATGGADQVLHYEIFASALDTFPFFPNSHLGFPEAQNLFFAPLFDPWSALFVRVASIAVPNGVWALNLYNLGSFVAVGFTSYTFFRALKLRRAIAVVFSVIFSTVPFHFVQISIGHPFLSNYWAVPLAGILVLMTAGDRTNPFTGWVLRATNRGQRLRRRLIPVLVLAPAVAFTQSYYFVFAALVVTAIWVVRCIVTFIGHGNFRRSFRELWWPTITAWSLLLLVGVQLAALSLNLDDRYQKYFGTRSFTESEYYGGKLMDLLLPSVDSGITPLANRAMLYQQSTGLLKTSESASTAVVASLAIILCFVLVLARSAWSAEAGRQTGGGGADGGDRVDETKSAAGNVSRSAGLRRLMTDARIGVLLAAFLISFLFFIASGLGTVLAFFVSPEIRAWSRFSIVVSMLALAVLAVVVDQLVRRTRMLILVLVVIAAVATADQVPRIAQTRPLLPVSDSALQTFTSDVEDALPADCGVVMLPLKGFPETGPRGAMGDYDEALPYVYAADGDNDLKWSYGAVAGTRSGDYWQDATTPAVFASKVSDAGGCAIVVDTFGYTEDVNGWQSFVSAVGDDPAAPAAVSPDAERRYLLFTLPG